MQIAEKILRIEICDSNDKIIITVDSNYTFTRVSEKNFDCDLLIIKGRNLPLLPRDGKISLIIQTKAGDRVKYNCGVAVSTEFQLNLLLYISKGILLEERRRFYKVECNTRCRILGIEREGAHTELKKAIIGAAKNINVGGIFLEVNSPGVEFKVDDILIAHLPDVIGAGIQCRILRVQVSSEGEIQGYGCSFIGLNSHLEQAVSQYINRLQLEKLRADRGSSNTLK